MSDLKTYGKIDKLEVTKDDVWVTLEDETYLHTNLNDTNYNAKFSTLLAAAINRLDVRIIYQIQGDINWIERVHVSGFNK